MVSWLSREDAAERYPGIRLPQHLSVPDFTYTRGPAVGRVCAAAGLVPDPEQQLGLDIVFAVRSDVDVSALVFALCIIVSRQNLKSAFFEMCIIGWLFVTCEEDITYSAHEAKTAAAIYRRLSNRIKNSPLLSKYLPLTDNQGCYSANGQMRIELANGRKCDFVTRTEDSSRGLGKNKLILDEAYALKQGHLDAILPNVLAKPDPQILYASSAPMADSLVLHELMAEGQAGLDEDLAFLQWLAPPAAEICDQGEECSHKWGTPGCGWDKPDYIAEANPAYGRRLMPRTMTNLRKRLKDGFGRECMGWPDEPITTGAPPAIDPAAWADCEDPYDETLDGQEIAPGVVYEYVAPPERMASFGIEYDLDRAWASICAVGQRDDGRWHVEVVDRRRGTAWVRRRANDLDQEQGPVPWVIDGGGPARDLIPDLEDDGLEVITAATRDVADAAAWLVDGARDRTIVRGPQEEIDVDVIKAIVKRPLGDGGFAFGRRKSEVDATPVVAISLAGWAAEHERAPSLW